MNIFANPNFIFVFVWGCLIFFHSLEITNNYVSPDVVALAIVGVNLFAALLLQLGVNHMKFHHVVDIQERLIIFITPRLPAINKVINLFLLIYFLISVMDVIYSGGFPMMWVLTGSEKLYVDFGIPTVHGLANGMVFFLCTLLTVLQLLGLKKCKWILFAILSWQILIFSRGVVMVVGAQSLCVILLMSRTGISTIWKYAIFSFLIIIGFGYLGDLRQNSNPYIGLVNDNWVSIVENLPSGFLWIYVYLTSGFNNFIFNIDLVTPEYFPYFSFSKLVPSIVYNLLGVDKSIDTFEFVNSGLNVSTIYSSFYSDFGVFAFSPVLLIQCFAIYYYCKAKNADVFALLKYCVLFQAIVFSPFIDTLFYLPFIVQFAFIKYLEVKIR